MTAVAPAVWAHGIHVTHAAGEAVRVTASFDSGEPMVAAQVSVFAPGDLETPWMTGTTDPAGQFAFVPDMTQTGRWEVQVRLAGHGEIVYVPVDEGAVATDLSPSHASASTTASADAGSELGEASVRRSPSLTAASPPRSPVGLSISQKLAMGAVFAWGCLGTALYAKRGTRVRPGHNANPQSGDLA